MGLRVSLRARWLLLGIVGSLLLSKSTFGQDTRFSQCCEQNPSQVAMEFLAWVEPPAVDLGVPLQEPSANQQTRPPLSDSSQSASPQQAPASSTPPETPSKTKAQEELEKQRLEQSYRVMGVVPMFGTTSRHDAPPLTRKEKFRIFYKSAFDPVNFAVVGFQAGISRAENSFPAYGQGAQGFGKYYGAAFADNVNANFFSNFFYPVLFRQDPRYFRSGEGSTKHRLWYSLQQEWVAHKDSGGQTFHFSNVLGAFTSGSISNAYYPESDRGFGLTMSRSAIALGYGTIGGIFSEFWPDIQAKIFKKHENRPGLSLPANDETGKPEPKVLSN